MPTYGNGANCDKLWRAWYLIIIVALNVFLIYLGIARYLTFKNQAFDPKFGGDWDLSGLNFTLGMIICSMSFFCLFLFVSFTRTTNYANEGVQIGRDTNNLHLLATCCNHPGSHYFTNYTQNGTGLVNGSSASESLIKRSEYPSHCVEHDQASTTPCEENMPLKTVESWPLNVPCPTERYVKRGYGSHLNLIKSIELLWQRFQRHFLPYTVALQLITGICLILPISVLQAQQISHRALTPDCIWRTDLDLLFAPPKALSITGSSSVSQSNMPPKENKVDSSAKQDQSYSDMDNLKAISPEFFNLALVLLLLCLRYPSVFWYTNRAFSFVFSFLLLLTGIQALLEYCAATILVKISWNQNNLKVLDGLNLATIPMKHSISAFDAQGTVSGANTNPGSFISFLKMNGPLFLTCVGTSMLLLLHTTIFEYGYVQFTENLSSYKRFLSVSNQTSCQHRSEFVDQKITTNGFGVNYDTPESDNLRKKSSICIGTNTSNHSSFGLGADLLHPLVRIFLYRYTPHIESIIGCLVIVAFKIPLIWDCFQIYRVSKHKLMLVSPICGILTICAWLIAWFAFSLKPAWKFQVNLPLQSISGMEMSGHTEQFVRPNVNEFNGPMMGSLLRPGSINLYRDMSGRPTLNGTVANFSQDDVASLQNQGTYPVSPIYACFHDPSSGYIGVPQRMLQFSSATANDGPCINGPGLMPIQQLPDHTTEDLEASSGRQSRNNYVCLQSALATGSVAQSIAVPMDSGVFLTRLDTAPVTPNEVCSSPNNQLVTFHLKDGGPLMPSPSSGRDNLEDGHDSIDGVQRCGFTSNDARYIGCGQTQPNYNAFSFNRNYLRPIASSSNQASSAEVKGSAFLSPIYPNRLTTTFTDGGFYHACDASSKSVDSPGASIESNTLVLPRVTFKENVDVIAQSSSIVSNQSSISIRSVERGLNFVRNLDKAIPCSSPSGSSGTYDNTFSAAFHAGLFQSGEVTPKKYDQTVSSPRNNYNSQLAHAPMNGSIHSQLVQPHERKLSFNQVNEAGKLDQNLASSSLQHSDRSEMIGDTSFQDAFASVISSSLKNDQEHQLCSQV